MQFHNRSGFPETKRSSSTFVEEEATTTQTCSGLVFSSWFMFGLRAPPWAEQILSSWHFQHETMEKKRYHVQQALWAPGRWAESRYIQVTPLQEVWAKPNQQVCVILLLTNLHVIQITDLWPKSQTNSSLRVTGAGCTSLTPFQTWFRSDFWHVKLYKHCRRSAPSERPCLADWLTSKQLLLSLRWFAVHMRVRPRIGRALTWCSSGGRDFRPTVKSWLIFPAAQIPHLVAMLDGEVPASGGVGRVISPPQGGARASSYFIKTLLLCDVTRNRDDDDDDDVGARGSNTWRPYKSHTRINRLICTFFFFNCQ